MSILLEAKPEPKVSWFRGATAISSGERIIIRNEAGSAADSYRLILEVSVSRSQCFQRSCVLLVRQDMLSFVRFVIVLKLADLFENSRLEFSKI